MADSPDDPMTKNRDRAEIRFAAMQMRRADQSRVKLENEEQARAGYEKTAKLRSLRLAKEAEDKALVTFGKPRSPKSGRVGKGAAR